MFTQVFAPSGSIVLANSQTTAILVAGARPLEFDGQKIHAGASSDLVIASGSLSTTVSLAAPSPGPLSEMFTTGKDGLPTPVVNNFVHTNAYATLTADRTPSDSALSSLGLLSGKTIRYPGEDKEGSLKTTSTSSGSHGSKAPSVSDMSSHSSDSITTKNNDDLTISGGYPQTTALQQPTESLIGSASDDTSNGSGVMLRGLRSQFWRFLLVILGLVVY